MHIQDAVVGDIEPTELELALINTKPMQRLRQIKQLSLGNLVYPGANHTRFEHSLGTMQITREVMQSSLKETDEELEIAGLLHDIGHCAFSHYSDDLLMKYLKTNHEKIGEGIIQKGEISDVLGKSGASVKKVISYFRGNGKGTIITGSLGSDRLDYLSRDAHYTGVAYGIIDYSIIRSRLAWYKGNPAVYKSGINGAESILIARYSMFASVYNHHVNRIARGIYEKAVIAAIDSGKMNKSELLIHDDYSIIARLQQIKESRELISRIVERRLFKRAYNEGVNGLLDLDAVKDAIEKTGIGENDYVMEVIKFKGATDDVDVLNKDGEYVGKLTELSALVRTLVSMDTKQKLLVACDASNTEKVRAAVEKAVS
ncbi:MAG: HD domain-containing protein [Candidatus Micrarchaeales archaeon]|nr:HD domain-containing protein [Candidatus Micrarchaeales archaeon]